jgi:hypothetical protein
VALSHHNDLVFVPLARPHASNGLGIGVPEAVDDLRLLPEMVDQRCPLRSDRCFHDANPPGGRCSDVRNRTVAFALRYQRPDVGNDPRRTSHVLGTK